MINPDEPAFFVSNRDLVPDRSIGLTKKEYIAALVIQGLLANPNGCMTADNRRSFNPDDMAKVSLAHTNAIINELNKDQ